MLARCMIAASHNGTASATVDWEVYHLLRGVSGAELLFSQACLRLHRHREGVQALERAAFMKSHPHGDAFGANDAPLDVASPLVVASKAAVHLQLANLACKGNEHAKAAKHYAMALQEDQWLWEAWDGLCHLGNELRAL